MSNQSSTGERKRTAVLVVHGMGSQRPLDTVRGVVNAVWRDRPENKVWIHPERSGTDIDLTVQTTSYVPGTERRIDFHELYWAHLIAETRAIAVLLWLFESAKRGPFLKQGMRPLWWGIATYLVFLLLSVSFLASEVVERLAKVETERVSMILTPVITTAIVAIFCTVWALVYSSYRLSRRAAGIGVVACLLLWGAWWVFRHCPGLLEDIATHFLPAAFALFVARFLMGPWAWVPFLCAYFISFAFHFLKLMVVDGTLTTALASEFIPWSLASTWSSVAAWLFITSYFVLSASFLQPYIGDVARYLRNSPANVAGRRDIRRNAVDTLLALHESGKYDRIIVVAHSLGTVVAYDMLRAAFARVYRDIPIDEAKLNPEFNEINEGGLDHTAWRRAARVLMRKLYGLVSDLEAQRPARPIGARQEKDGPKAWLVTDFITLGSPLTHAHYLLCHGKDPGAPLRAVNELIDDFNRRVEEREFPTCQPKMIDGDKVLTYDHGASGTKRFHHAALFGLTRWTNLYFKLDQVFWGDPIGGPVAMYETGEKDKDGNRTKKELFGKDVIDVAVSTRESGEATFFTHTAYWSVERTSPPSGTPDPPHIEALKLAINLADTGAADDPGNFNKIKGVRVLAG